MLKEGNVCPKHIYLQFRTWYVPHNHTKGHVFTGYTSMYAVFAKILTKTVI